MDRGTIKFKLTNDKEDIREVLHQVYDALKAKGYNPLNQIVGYIISGDPTYITSYNNARAMITRIDRNDLLEEMTLAFLKDHCGIASND